MDGAVPDTFTAAAVVALAAIGALALATARLPGQALANAALLLGCQADAVHADLVDRPLPLLLLLGAQAALIVDAAAVGGRTALEASAGLSLRDRRTARDLDAASADALLTGWAVALNRVAAIVAELAALSG